MRERLISAVSVGFFLVLLGAIFMSTSGFFDSISAFFLDFGIAEVPNLSSVFLPAPKNPANHAIVYSAAVQFSLAWGTFLVGLLVVRLLARSPLQKKAENVSDITFWLASSFLIGKFLNETTTPTTWFTFWAAVIALIGATMVIRAIILAAFK